MLQNEAIFYLAQSATAVSDQSPSALLLLCFPCSTPLCATQQLLDNA